MANAYDANKKVHIRSHIYMLCNAEFKALDLKKFPENQHAPGPL